MYIYQKSKLISALGLSLVLSACAVPDWLGAGESEPRLPGERYEVMSISSDLRIDESMQSDNIVIPPAVALHENNQGNTALAGQLQKQKTIDIGESADDFFRITATPIFAEDMIFVADGKNKVSAFNTNLQKIWDRKVTGQNGVEDTIPAGIAYKKGKVFISTGSGTIAALDAKNGGIIWEKHLESAVRNAPSVDSLESSDKIFVATAENKTFALSASTGKIIWRHSGIEERTRKFASVSPVAKNNVVASAYASGEIFGISAIQGREIWSELVSIGQSQTKAASGLNDISTKPLVVDGIIYATSAGGKLVALNFNNGSRIWERSVSGVATPWVADRYLFIINEDEEMIALNRFDGRVKWVKLLRNDEQKEDRKRVKWQGPILAGGNLIAHNNDGQMVIIEPNEGNTVLRKEIPDDVYTPAKVIAGKIYMLSNDAQLIELH